jgi:hypothetical protein
MTTEPYGKREAPFSLRLSFEERARLTKAAGGMPIASYIKSLLFAEDAPIYRMRGRNPVKDEKALAELLACLGASRIANNLNQLAKAANSGSFYFDRETRAKLVAACEDVKAMRQLLMLALGMKLGEEPQARQSASQSFARATLARPRP